jgi:hypothetical protein
VARALGRSSADVGDTGARAFAALVRVCAGSLLLLPVFSSALAHTIDTPKSDLVRLEPGSVTVIVDYVVPATEAENLRAIYDTDRDRKLAPRERAGMIAWMSLAATHFLAVDVDGAALALTEDESARAVDGLDDGNGDLHGTFVMRAKLPRKGAHTLSVRDRHKDATIPVPVRVVLVGGIEGDAKSEVLGPERAVLAVGFRAP